MIEILLEIFIAMWMALWILFVIHANIAYWSMSKADRRRYEQEARENGWDAW